MPIGPSHGARGGGFSSGSDGGRSRRSSGGSSFLGEVVGHVLGAAILTAGARRRRRHFEHRYGYNPSDNEINSMPRRRTPTYLLFFAIFIAIISAFTMMIRNGAVQRLTTVEGKISDMQSDWTEYRELIDKAKLNLDDNYYIIEAQFSPVKYSYYSDNPSMPAAYYDFKLNDTSYYFVVYSYTDHNHITHKGATYSQFPASKIQTMNGRVQIAYFDDGSDHYSINLDLPEKVEDCAEYKYQLASKILAKESANKFLIAFIVEILIVALFVTLYILKLRKHNKLVAQDEELLFKKQQAETERAEAEADAAQYAAQRHNRFCQYCGGQLDADSNTCSSCGAKFSQE